MKVMTNADFECLKKQSAEEKIAYAKLIEMNVEQRFKLYEKYNDNLCGICNIRIYGCNGLSSGSNGPIYPRCADGDVNDYVDYEKLEDECLQIILDELE